MLYPYHCYYPYYLIIPTIHIITLSLITVKTSMGRGHYNPLIASHHNILQVHTILNLGSDSK